MSGDNVVSNLNRAAVDISMLNAPFRLSITPGDVLEYFERGRTGVPGVGIAPRGLAGWSSVCLISFDHVRQGDTVAWVSS